MVYVLNVHGKPLMPTNRHGKVKHLLNQGRAKVVRRTPFTIQLLYESTNYTQSITLGVDAGSKTVGLSASTDDKEVFSAELKPRNDVVKKLSDRRSLRRSRRHRTTRYRAPRFNNRTRTKPKGWLAPSVRVKIHNHIQGIKLISRILPITRIADLVNLMDFKDKLLYSREFRCRTFISRLENQAYQKSQSPDTQNKTQQRRNP